MRYILIVFFAFATGISAFGQGKPTRTRLLTGYGPLDAKLAKMVTADEKAISPDQAKEMDYAIYLDTRETVEYETAHIPGAIHIGYEDLNLDQLSNIDKDRPLIVYCTIGYRSERIAKKIRKKGFTKVFNLYGSLYAWKLAGNNLVDRNGDSTERYHTYNKAWSDYMPDSVGTKVW